VQPLQARKNPLWKYAGDNDVDRLSVDLPVKDLEKLVRKISSLSKKDPVPSSCRVKPYSAANALPKVTFVDSLFLFDILCITPLLTSLFALYRTIQILSLFLPFLKVGKSKNEPLSLMTTRMLLALIVNPQVLENLRDPLKRKLNPRVPPRHTLLLLLFLQRTKGRGLMSKIPAPPKPKKLLLHVGRQLSIHTLKPSSVRKSPFVSYCFAT
jgi:hypothetical protein